MTRVFRPGTVDRFLARLRRARSTVWTPKSASEFPSDGPRVEGANEATITGDCALGETAEVFIPITTCFKRLASAVKFCEMCTLPPKSAMAIKRSGPAFASINFAAARSEEHTSELQ